MEYISTSFKVLEGQDLLNPKSLIYAWELWDFLKYSDHFAAVGLNDDQINCLVHHAVGVAGVDLTEMRDYMDVKVRHKFFLAHLEQCLMFRV
jgi:hypothetical protein